MKIDMEILNRMKKFFLVYQRRVSLPWRITEASPPQPTDSFSTIGPAPPNSQGRHIFTPIMKRLVGDNAADKALSPHFEGSDAAEMLCFGQTLA
jgi:hypothetical protein